MKFERLAEIKVACKDNEEAREAEMTRVKKEIETLKKRKIKEAQERLSEKKKQVQRAYREEIREDLRHQGEPAV